MDAGDRVPAAGKKDDERQGHDRDQDHGDDDGVHVGEHVVREVDTDDAAEHESAQRGPSVRGGQAAGLRTAPELAWSDSRVTGGLSRVIER